MNAAEVTITVDELDRLRATEREYAVTVRVLAIVVERLLVITDGQMMSVTDEAIAAPPDLRAWRDHDAKSVVVTVSR